MSQQEVMNYLKENSKGLIKDMALSIGINESNISRSCKKLYETGFIFRKPITEFGKFKYYEYWRKD